MSLTKENSIEYVYNEDEYIGIESEYVYDELSSAKSTKEDIGIERDKKLKLKLHVSYVKVDL